MLITTTHKIRAVLAVAAGAYQALDHMLVSVREHAWPNVPSVRVAAAEVKTRRPRR